MPIVVQASYQASNSPFFPVSFAGFLGGDATASALAYSHVYGRRNLPNLYNAPGSYGVAKLLKALVQSHFWDGLHAGISVDPDALSDTAVRAPGPKFMAAFSGTAMESAGDVARMLVSYCKTLPIHSVAEGRVTTPFAVTVADLHHVPASEEHPTLNANAPLLPILASIGASAACATFGDWRCFSMIVLGMLCNAATSSVLRSGDLTFTRPGTTPGAPAGDGFLEDGNEVVVLKGSEGAVSAVTRGRFSLRFANKKSLERLATCATLSIIQSLAQLIIVPQSTVLGQFFFFLSMAVAWLYHSLMSPMDKRVKERVVMEHLLKEPSLKRYSLGTRAMMAVFLMQVLQPTNAEEQLAALIPNKTRVWSAWRQIVARRISEEKPVFDTALPTEATGFTTEEVTLLRTLLSDAQAAVNVYNNAKRGL
ncbi:hypothetical protein BD414DRAFT_454172 [Trametes punicea]|nr:hypothetical protein BD414DRAFT_454172 [Trametes punicea]